MNIFVVDSEPRVCAQYLDDKRVNKMLLETAQILSTVLNGPYKPTHVNHPCTAWVRSETVNLYWTAKYFVELGNEYYSRRNRIHKSYDIMSKFLIEEHPALWNVVCAVHVKTPDTFCNCSHYKDSDDVFTAYKKTLQEKWASDVRRPTWHGLSRGED